ncbi:hypothetical protein B5E41_23110 [Rhizobium esperanzae]|uniref:Uncharacterized protein n=1 Tax=Rhizobium esperanzae TaxID=1967781 RepID=A0A246DQ03_9HYPH|nr:hypothetical protein B5E41_23110 [Rhizobium esperanzae]
MRLRRFFSLSSLSLPAGRRNGAFKFGDAVSSATLLLGRHGFDLAGRAVKCSCNGAKRECF